MPEHHREMILVAPVFLALGFGAGWLANSIVQISERFRAAIPAANDVWLVFRGMVLPPL